MLVSLASKKILLTSTLFVSSVALSACVPGLNNQPAEETPANQEQAAAQAQQAAAEMAAAIESGQPVRCVASNQELSETSEFYIKGPMMRAKNSTLEEGTEVISHVITDQEVMYVWTEDGSTALKMNLPSDEEMAQNAEEYQAYLDQAPDFSDESVREEYQADGYTLDCQPTDLDDSFFTPPSDVTFTDTSAMMEQAEKMMREIPQNMEVTPEQRAALEKLRGMGQ